MQLVPPERRQQKTPCRHIALNAQGETIDYFYRCGTPEELEKALISWLKATVGTIEAERARKKLAKTA